MVGANGLELSIVSRPSFHADYRDFLRFCKRRSTPLTHSTRVLAKVAGIIGSHFHFAWRVGVVGVRVLSAVVCVSKFAVCQ